MRPKRGHKKGEKKDDKKRLVESHKRGEDKVNKIDDKKNWKMQKTPQEADQKIREPKKHKEKNYQQSCVGN